MDDASLEDLMAALQDVQEVKATARLSERNVVELINRIQELGFLENKLLHSVHGREYITPEQLCREVQQQVEQAGGRLALSDLPAQLGVDLEHCKRQAESAADSSQGSLQLIQGELMSESYFDSVASEVEEALRESGMVSMVNLARRFKLGSELMHAIVKLHLGKDIHGQLESGILSTTTYNTRIKAQVRGALRAARLPVNLSVLIKTLQLTVAPSIQKSVQTAVEELLQERAIFGVLKAGTFIPTLYTQGQQATAQSFYQQNYFIEYATLEKLGITDSKSYIVNNFSEALCLGAVAISPQLTAQLEAAVEEAVISGSWMDAMTHLPTALGPSDVAQLLDQVLSNPSRCGANSSPEILAGTCVASNAFLEDVQQRCLEYAREAAEKSLKDRRKPGAAAPASNPEGVANKGASKQTAADDSDDDWDLGKGGSKKKKGGRKRNTSKGKGSAGGSLPQQPSKASQGSQAKTSAALGVENIVSKIEEWFPGTSGCGEAANLPEVLTQRYRSAAVAEYEKTLNAVFLAGAEARRRKRDEIARAADESYQRMQLYTHGAELLQEDTATYTALQKHILRGFGQGVLDLILRFVEADLLKGEEDAAADTGKDPEASGPLKTSEKARIIKALPSDIAPAVNSAEKALEGDDSQEAQLKLWEAANAGGLQLKKLEKKVEKMMVQSFRLRLLESLKSENNPAEILSTAVPILFAKVHGRATSVPGKALAGVIGHLKSSLQSEDAETLVKFHGLVVQSLRSEINSLNENNLITLVPAVLSMCGVNKEPQEES